MNINIQEFYEDILSAHWHKIYNVNELKRTNTSFHPLRLKSIDDREKELRHIEAKKEAMELLFEDELTIPDWYNDRIREQKK